MKEQIILIIGNLLIRLFPGKARNLVKKGLTLNTNLTFVERFMKKSIFHQAELTNNIDELATIHKNYWANQGKDFFSRNKDIFEAFFIPNFAFIFDILKEKILNSRHEYDTIVEIGTSNGDALHYLEKKFPEIDNFIGIDLSTEQIDINKLRFKENFRLKFVASDGFDWLKKEGRNKMIFVAVGGVFEYFNENQINDFIKYANSLGKVLFVIAEPNGLNHNFEQNPNSEIYGWEKSFSHNHQKIFQNYGFNILYNSTKQFDGCIFRYIIAEN